MSDSMETLNLSLLKHFYSKVNILIIYRYFFLKTPIYRFMFINEIYK